MKYQSYEKQALAGDVLKNQPSTRPVGTVSAKLNHLAELLAQAHDSTSRVERVADRITGCAPAVPTEAEAEPRPDTIDGRLNTMIEIAQELCNRVAAVADRLDAAV